MCEKSHRQTAKELHSLLVENKVIDRFYEGLLGDKIWVSKNCRAYPLSELADAHLANIINRFNRDNEAIPRAIIEEQTRREFPKTETYTIIIEETSEVGPEYSHQVTIIKDGSKWQDKWYHRPTLSEAVKVYENLRGDE